jgi:hypothetical protein
VFSQFVDYLDLDNAVLDVDSAILRIWLPEACKAALAETVKARQETAAAWLRAFLVAYVFGEHELTRMWVHKKGLYYEPDWRNGVAFCQDGSPRKGEPAPAPQEALRGLGKNIHPLKVYLPSRLKFELDTLAQRVEMELSPFVRMLLVSRLLGHSAWYRLSEPWIEQHQAAIALAWERGERAPDALWPEEFDAEKGDRWVERL